jgi:hypothetical protein
MIARNIAISFLRIPSTVIIRFPASSYTGRSKTELAGWHAGHHRHQYKQSMHPGYHIGNYAKDWTVSEEYYVWVTCKKLIGVV